METKVFPFSSHFWFGWWSMVVPYQSAIKYELDELSACKTLLDDGLQDDPDTIINYAAISYKEVSLSCGLPPRLF